MAKKRNSTSAVRDPEAVVTGRKSKRLAFLVATEAAESFLISDEVVEVLENDDCEDTPNSSTAAVNAVNEDDKKLKVSAEKEDEDDEEDECIVRFLGEPVPGEEARRRWPQRYQKNQKEITQARFHFLQAEVDGQNFNLEDDAYVKADEGKDNYICKIIEFFEARDGSLNFTAQWYYRAVDTAIKDCNNLIKDTEIFFSKIKDDNPLDCLVKKLKIVFLPSKADLNEKKNINPSFDYYYNKIYLLPYCSFVNIHSDCSTYSSESNSTISSDAEAEAISFSEVEEHSIERTVLDLYSGCGAMSTGLCLGSNIGGVRLVTKWAVDINQYACESLKLNHPETQVRNESAEDFLHLLKEWEMLCASFLSLDKNGLSSEIGNPNDIEDDESDDNDEEDVDGNESEIFEVQEILSICYGDPNDNKKPGLYFKIRWKHYGAEDDTWEPLGGLSACKEKLRKFVSIGYKFKILPLPGTVDVVCGGPPCQGISGFNRFRNKDQPLEDTKNRQLLVFMDIVAHLRPKFVLMENVVDLVKFSNGFLGRYALGSLVAMGYQARMGMMVAGAYGLPQYRMRVFMWGALHTEKLPQYPLPTHNVVVRGNTPTEFESNVVGHEGQQVQLKKELFLDDAISDLPPVENNEERDEILYNSEPKTEFQKLIRLRRIEMLGCLMFKSEPSEHNLYDHRPLQLNQDDYERVCQIPKKKVTPKPYKHFARDLPGVRVRADKKVEWDPDVERVLLSSGKPLVPDYAMTFVRGTSSKPFGRLWWDEIVSTVITRAEPHNHVILHPLQDRVLTVRENARLQGFPDYYKLFGPVKERYIQVGNAVAVPVARALGYSLAMAMRGLSGEGPLLSLPEDFPLNRDVPSPSIMML